MSAFTEIPAWKQRLLDRKAKKALQTQKNSTDISSDSDVTCLKSSKNHKEYTFTMASAKENGAKKLSIQDRFALFRKKKLAESRLRKYVSKKGKRTTLQKEALRRKFVKQVESYIGVPYAQKYHDKGTKDYDAPLFLDCCALVRRAINDLQEDFGFRLGRWNQNYQFSTLSNGDPTLETDPAKKQMSELKPGDLIFYTATYNSEKARKQRLRLVHVEVFTGTGADGEGSIGARWQKGHVKYFESHKFESKSYHSIEFHYRSIEPWLNGMCSVAPNHIGWWVDQNVNRAVNKYSMFHADSKDLNEFCDQDAGDVDDENGLPMVRATRKQFYVGKSNGYKMIQNCLINRGWSQIPFDENFNTKYTLKWVERRSQIDWLGHKDGTIKTFKNKKGNQIEKQQVLQIVNHIANNNVITVKTGLLHCLREASDEIKQCARLPETYDLSIASDRLHFLKVTENHDEYMDSDEEDASTPGTMWILKPSSMNRGRGIKVINDVTDLRRDLMGGKHNEYDGDNDMGIDDWKGKSMDMLAQRYLSTPLLVHGTRKFDLRAYCLISKCDNNNLIAYYHHGYTRVSLVDYETTDSSLSNNLVHLTNIAIQRQHPDYEKLKNDAVLSMNGLEKAIECPNGWVAKELEPQMMSSMAAVIQSAATKFDRRAGCFDLLGFDFMVGNDLKVHLIEVNTNPALHVSDGKVLQELLPKVVAGTLDIVLETTATEESNENEQISREGFHLIFDEKKEFKYMTFEQRLFQTEKRNKAQMLKMKKIEKMLRV